MPPPDPTPDPNAAPGGIQGLLGNLFPGNNAAALYGGLLSDPATQQQFNQRALSAMAGSFADSAMPTRVPTPFGAVLGHAAAAAGTSGDAVMAARLQAAQAQQEQAQAAVMQQNIEQQKLVPGLMAAIYGQGAGGTTPTVPGTVGAPTVATVPHDAGPGWMAGWKIPDNAATATVDPKDDGATNLNRLAQTAIPIALPGYTVKMVSGERPGAVVGGDGGESQHAKANAADFKIYKPDGTEIPNEGPDATGAYSKLALTMRMIAPENIKPWLGWGGNFSTRADNDVRDLMHFDFAGDRGRFGSLAQMEAQWKAAQNAPPGGAAPGAAGPQVAASSGWTTPGSWFGNSPGWVDKTDRGPQANGQPVSAGPGIALPTPRDSPQFGGWYDVTFPNGKTLRLQQTDVGPGAKGRGIDVNSVAAAQAGYTPGTFPTDAPIRVQPVTAGAAPPIRLAANTVTGTATDAPTGLLTGTAPAPMAAPAPGAPAVAPGAAPPAALPPGAPPPGAPPQAPAGPPPSLVTPPPPAAPAPPITQPQVAAAPPAVAPGAIPPVAGAPSPEQIRAAQALSAVYQSMYPPRPVPPEIAAIAGWNIKAAEAQRDALIKYYTTAQRPGASIPLPGGGYATAPVQPIRVSGLNPQGQTTERLVDPLTGRDVAPLGVTGASPEDIEAQRRRAGVAPSWVPGAPLGPGAFPQAPDPTKPIPSPGRYGTSIPALNQQALPTVPDTYSDAAKGWVKESSDLADAGLKAQNAEANLNGIVKAYSMVQTGTWATQKAEFTGLLKFLGLPVDTSNLAALQTALHNLYKETLQDLSGVNKRFTGNEFKVNTEAGASAGNQPAANLNLLAQDLGRLRQMQALADDWNHAQTVTGSDGSRWVNPDSFKTAWIRQNPLQPMVDKARNDISPFIKGTPGWVPPGALPPGVTPDDIEREIRRRQGG